MSRAKAQVAGPAPACFNAGSNGRGPRATRGNVMTSLIAGGVDCDVHPAVPHLTSLLPYLNDYWRDQVTTRGMATLFPKPYPQNPPIVARPDWRPETGKPGASLEDMQRHLLDPFQLTYA